MIGINLDIILIKLKFIKLILSRFKMNLLVNFLFNFILFIYSSNFFKQLLIKQIINKGTLIHLKS